MDCYADKKSKFNNMKGMAKYKVKRLFKNWGFSSKYLCQTERWAFTVKMLIVTDLVA